MKSNEELVQLLMERMSGLDFVHPEDLPDIDLYMDQLTTYMERELSHSKRHADDKILTKAMINNYAKNDLLPPPVKKKYSQEHLLTLIFIYYFKSILSIQDIQTLLNPLTERYFHAPDGLTLTDIYNAVYALETPQAERVKDDALFCYQTACETFPEAEGEERDLLQRFAFICMMGFDIYMKKQVIELLIDEMAADDADRKSEKSEKKKARINAPDEHPEI